MLLILIWESYFDTSIINAGDSADFVTADLKPGDYLYFLTTVEYFISYTVLLIDIFKIAIFRFASVELVVMMGPNALSNLVSLEFMFERPQRYHHLLSRSKYIG
jgi:hypothetical protein